MRAIFLNAPTGRTFTSGDVAVNVAGEPIESEIPSHGHLHLQASPKSDSSASVKFEFTPPAGEPFVVDTDMKVKATRRSTTPFSMRRKEKEAKESITPSWEGDLKLIALPHGVELSRGLTNTVHWLTVDGDGRPVAAMVTFEKVEGLVSPGIEDFQTDRFGISSSTFSPESTLRLTVKVEELNGDRSGTGKMNLFTAASQFQITMANLIVDGNAEGQVESLHRSGALFVDVYDGDVWRKADAFGVRSNGTGFRIDASDVKTPVARIQVYQNLFAAGDAWDVAYVAVGNPVQCQETLLKVSKFAGTTKSDAQKWVRRIASAAEQSSLSNRNCRRLLKVVLASIPKTFTPASVLVNSQKRDRAKLDAWRKEVQADLQIATGVALLSGLIVIVLLVLQGVARAREQERLFREIDAEIEDGEVLQISPVEQILVYSRVVIIVITLAMFAAAIMMLLNFM